MKNKIIAYEPFFIIPAKGVNQKIIREISEQKDEPGWMTDFRLKALEVFERLSFPQWGPDLSSLHLDNLWYYIRPLSQARASWKDVPDSLKKTFDALGVPEIEQAWLAGLGTQLDSEMIYKNLKTRWENLGIIFLDISEALKEYPELFKHYFAKLIYADHKFAALNSACWSGGSFVYIPEGVCLTEPLQVYFRIEQQRMGQFERTLMIAEKGSSLHYIEGCSAPVYHRACLHCGVVEIFAHEHSTISYTTIQNWSKNVYNLVTKRAQVEKQAKLYWIDGNFGSGITMKYPTANLVGKGAEAHFVSVGISSENQHHDMGSCVIHQAPDTKSSILSRSISQHGGRASYRGKVEIKKGACGSKSTVTCQSLVLDHLSRADSYPLVKSEEKNVDVSHEASINNLKEEQLYFLMLYGLDEENARTLLVQGYLYPFIKELPMEYAIEIKRLMQLYAVRKGAL